MTMTVTAADLASLCKQYQHCFAIENHQGTPGPESLPTVLPTEEECARVLADAWRLVDSAPRTLMAAAFLAAWHNRGEAEVTSRWKSGASAESCDLPQSLC